MVEIIEAHDMGDDILRVRYTDGETRRVATGRMVQVRTGFLGHKRAAVPEEGDALVVKEAFGWVSAMENHPHDDTRDEHGHRINDKRRKMTKDERHGYIVGLIGEARAPKRLGI